MRAQLRLDGLDGLSAAELAVVAERANRLAYEKRCGNAFKASRCGLDKEHDGEHRDETYEWQNGRIIEGVVTWDRESRYDVNGAPLKITVD